jgi:hypothetical protein
MSAQFLESPGASPPSVEAISGATLQALTEGRRKSGVGYEHVGPKATELVYEAVVFALGCSVEELTIYAEVMDDSVLPSDEIAAEERHLFGSITDLCNRNHAALQADESLTHTQVHDFTVLGLRRTTAQRWFRLSYLRWRGPRDAAARYSEEFLEGIILANLATRDVWESLTGQKHSYSETTDI